MFSLLKSVGCWGIDFHLGAFLLLSVAVTASFFARQPVRRLTIGWSAMASIPLLAVLTVLPGWPRIAWRRVPPPEASERSAPTRLHRQAEIRRAVGAAPALDRNTASAPETSVGDRGRGPVSPGERDFAGRPTRTVRSGILDLNYPAAIGATIVAGAIAAGVWLLFGAAQTARLRRRALPATDQLNELLCEIDHAAAPKPRMLVSADVDLPLATGILKPVIIVPQRCVTSVEAADLEAVVAHEWAHIRHGDLWLLALSRLLLLSKQLAELLSEPLDRGFAAMALVCGLSGFDVCIFAFCILT